MKRFGFVRLILCLGVLVFSVHEAFALDATLSGDASVNSAHASTPYGALSNLYVGNGNTTFLNFDLKMLPAGTTSAQVSQATLTVFVNRVNAAGAVAVSPVTVAWDEYSVTSATAPPIGASLGNLSVSVPGQFVSVDVTAQVQAWLTAAAQNTGFALTSSAANVLFDSKENDETGHAARLDITLVNQGPQGIQGIHGVPGIAGATGAPGPIGAPGIAGAPGAVGPVGPTGATGAIGATGPQGPPVSFQGVWSNATTYSTGDAVFYNGSSYISLQNANTGNSPATVPTEWSLLAQQGAIGSTGAAGPQGATGLTGATGAAGPAGPVGATGATGPQGPIGLTGATGATGVAGPAGATGAQGAVGSQGPQGPPVSFIGPWNSSTPYSIGSAASEGGTSYIALAANSAIDPATDVSGSGGNWAVLAQAGASGTVSVGTTTTGASGSSASVTNTGTSSAAVLNFTVPQGPAGPAGATGVAGPSGPTGPAGPAGTAGQNGSGVNAVNFVTSFTNGEPSPGSTYYISPISSIVNFTTNGSIATSSQTNFVAMPIGCTMSALNVGVNNYFLAGADTTTITVYKNQAATSMTCSVTTNGNGSSCQDKTHTFSVAGGDSISLAFSETAGTPYNMISVGLVCQ